MKRKREREGKERKGRDSLDLFLQEKFPIATPMQKMRAIIHKKALAARAKRPPDFFFHGFVRGPH